MIDILKYCLYAVFRFWTCIKYSPPQALSEIIHIRNGIKKSGAVAAV